MCKYGTWRHPTRHGRGAGQGHKTQLTCTALTAVPGLVQWYAGTLMQCCTGTHADAARTTLTQVTWLMGRAAVLVGRRREWPLPSVVAVSTMYCKWCHCPRVQALAPVANPLAAARLSAGPTDARASFSHSALLCSVRVGAAELA